MLGKGIANGRPLDAITGSRKYMEKFSDVFFSTTYGGETLSLAAANAVIDEMKQKPVINHCWNIGNIMMKEFNQKAEEINVNIKMEGLPIRSSIICRDKNNNQSLLLKSLFYQEMVKQGILFGPGYVFFSYSHSLKDIKNTLNACNNAMLKVKKTIQEDKIRKELKGNIMKPVMTF